MTDAICFFTGDNRFLSNFWPAEVELNGDKYPTVEHAYVAAKTFDLNQREFIRTIAEPALVKRYGRKLILRPGWDAHKLEIMSDLVWQKFDIKYLALRLLATGDAELIEGNTWGDTYWGVCRGKGENHLGKILMAKRKSLQD